MGTLLSSKKGEAQDRSRTAKTHGNVEVPTINQPVASMGEASSSSTEELEREGSSFSISQCVYAKNYMVCNMAILHIPSACCEGTWAHVLVI